MNKGILERLNNGEILICDGSMGIMLQSLGCPPDVSIEKWGLENSDVVSNLHKDYIEAGADIIITNTLGGSRIKLDKYNLGNEVISINKGLAEIAVDTASKFSKRIYVAGNIGPSGELMMPYGLLTESEIIKSFSEQVKGLLDGKVDFFFIETMIDVNEALSAIKAIKELCNLPIFASMSFNPVKNGFRTVMGNSPQQVVEMLQSAGADVIGSNCGSTFAPDMPALMMQMKSAGARLLVAEPNAGLPEIINGKTVFPHTPEQMAKYVPDMIDSGASVIGGCCGTNAEHIRLMAQTAHRHIKDRSKNCREDDI